MTTNLSIEQTQDYLKLIENAKIISFDIFDTLLVRPYKKPVDLFLHLEKLYSADNFMKNRIRAEKTARLKNKEKEDITFDSIYENIDKKYKFLKEKELELEFDTLRFNGQISEIYNYALSLGKRIIITSDMYLPKEFVIKLLNKNGISEFEKLYISSDSGLTKQSSSLYKHIIKDLNVKPNEICHIGDNLFSDIENAQKLGIKTIYIEKNTEILLKKNERLKIISDKFDNYIGQSVLTGLFANNYPKGTYFYNFGFLYAGPVIFSFVNWLYENFKNDKIEAALFAARDGYILKKVFDFLYCDKNIQSLYVYASRRLKTLYISEKTDKSEYQNYINSLNIKASKIAVIDSRTVSYSAQVLLKNFLKGDFTGCYWACNKKMINRYKVKKYKTDNKKFKFDWSIMEFFMSAPEPPIKDIENLKPVYFEINSDEKNRIEIYKELSLGIIDFARCVKSIFNDKNIFIDYKLINFYLETLNNISSDKDKEMFKTLYHYTDINHTNHTALFPNWYIERRYKTLKSFVFSKYKENERQVIQILGIKIKRKIKSIV